MTPDVDAEAGGSSSTNNNRSNKKLVEIALSPPRDKNGSSKTMVVVRSGGEAGSITDVKVRKACVCVDKGRRTNHLSHCLPVLTPPSLLPVFSTIGYQQQPQPRQQHRHALFLVEPGKEKAERWLHAGLAGGHHGQRS
jgi:hypothetical protein